MTPADYRKDLTDEIIRQLEAGTAPWVKPWDPSLGVSGVPHNAVTGNVYCGGNMVWLACQGHIDPRWCTYRQAQERGWQVAKGQRSTMIEYWQWSKEQKDAQGRIVEVKLDAPRVFYASIFNGDQIENIPRFEPIAPAWLPEEAAETILRNSGAAIFHDQKDAAYYAVQADQIHLPPPSMYPLSSGYYSTALHELGHWTGHPARLNRTLNNKFGTSDYAREELRAELASYFISARLGIPHDPARHASYVASWIQLLRQDHNELFRASKDAENVCAYVLEFQHEKALETTQQHIQAEPAGALRPEPSISREAELEC